MYTPHLSDSNVNTLNHHNGAWTTPVVDFLSADSGVEVANAINSILANTDIYRVNSVSEIKCMAAQHTGVSRVEPRVCFATIYYQMRDVPVQHDDDIDDGSDYEDIPAFVEP